MKVMPIYVVQCNTQIVKIACSLLTKPFPLVWQQRDSREMYRYELSLSLAFTGLRI